MRSTEYLAATLAVLAICRGGSGASQSPNSISLLVKECEENALHLRVDPEPLRRLVGSQRRLVLEDGKSHVLIVVQDCSRSWIDGADVGPTQYTHIWVLIEGAGDVRPVFGAQLTRPTMTWAALFTGSTNARERDFRRNSGTSPEAIKRVSVSGLHSRSRGQVVVGDGMNYSWDVRPATAPTRLVGVNHDVYSPDSAGRVVLRRIQALGQLIGDPVNATLHVVGGTDPRRVIGNGDYPVLVNVFARIWVRTAMAAGPEP